jgi:hypothetical protein
LTVETCFNYQLNAHFLYSIIYVFCLFVFLALQPSSGL